jgi:hypothetical protein
MCLTETNPSPLASHARNAYIPPMSFFGRFSPVRAIRDLRLFLSQRQPYELVFLMIAVGITGFFIYAFARDDYVPVPYKPDIIYVEQWPADRTDVQIKAQQKIDYVKKKERLAEEKAAKDQRQAEFKRVDDALNKWGI